MQDLLLPTWHEKMSGVAEGSNFPRHLSAPIITLFPPGMYHAKLWFSCLFETWNQNNNIYCWHMWLCLSRQLKVMDSFSPSKQRDHLLMHSHNFINVLFKMVLSWGKMQITSQFYLFCPSSFLSALLIYSDTDSQQQPLRNSLHPPVSWFFKVQKF